MNASATRKLQLTGAAGVIEALVDDAVLTTAQPAPRGMAIIAHPHPLFGGTMDNKVVHTLARAFVQSGWTALRFNFRGVGASQGVYDEGRGELDDLLGVVAQTAPAGTLATGTITMPGSPADGMVITITTTQEITALTINGNTGQSIGGTQVAQMPANSAMSFVYRQSNTTWYRNSAPALGNVGTAPVYAARAWVNFNGTGTVAIRASGNVSSITDNGTGDYTVNFTTAMPDANYALAGTCERNYATENGTSLNQNSQTAATTSAVRVTTWRVTTGNVDPANVYVVIHR